MLSTTFFSIWVAQYNQYFLNKRTDVLYNDPISRNYSWHGNFAPHTKYSFQHFLCKIIRNISVFLINCTFRIKMSWNMKPCIQNVIVLLFIQILFVKEGFKSFILFKPLPVDLMHVLALSIVRRYIKSSLFQRQLNKTCRLEVFYTILKFVVFSFLTFETMH